MIRSGGECVKRKWVVLNLYAADLRKRYREFLWDGEFSGTVGAAVTRGGDKCGIAGR